MTLPAGIHTITMSEYLALNALSSGVCHTLLTYSPFHAKFQQDSGEDDPSTVSEKGTAIHGALLEGSDRVVLIDPEQYPSAKGGIPVGWTNNAIREARDFARSQGSIPMLPDNYASVIGAVKAAKAFIRGSEIAGVFDSGKSEQTIIWKEGDISCKARPDWLGDDIVLHVKTTASSAGPFSFPRLVDNMGYDISLMFYARGLSVFHPHIFRHVILAIEQDAPHGCALYDLDPVKADIASRCVDLAIRTWQECTASGKWPCYDSRIHSIEPKPWQISEQEERDTNDVYDQLQAKEGLQP